MLKKIIPMSILSFLISSCSSNLTTNSINQNNTNNQIIIQGKVDFINNSGFKTKATLSTISNESVVSLIDKDTGKVEGVAITNTAGSFALVAGAPAKFSPSSTKIYILEAQKRVDSSTGAVSPSLGSFVSLRTMVVFKPAFGGTLSINGISGVASAVKVNKYTTALSLMFAKGSVRQIGDIIGKIDVTTPVGVDISDTSITSVPPVYITAAQVEDLATQVEGKIIANLDPITSLNSGGNGTQIGGTVGG